MRNRRFLGTIAAALGAVALLPVATAIGDDPGGGEGRSIEAVTALSTTFTYQGRLTDAGSPANGTYDMRFILYDAESGGAQVGGTVNKEDVIVTNGLFSVELDFGATALNGDARWVEIAVRPGTSAAAHTVLSPRQPVSPAPYALFAKAAGGFAVPLTATGSSAGAPSTTTGLLTVEQAGTGVAIAGNRNSTDASLYPGVLGTNDGGGAGVQGESTFASGVGVQGFATGATGIGGAFSGATGVKATSSTATGAALELDGQLKVSGTNPAAFVHTTVTSGTGQNTCTGAFGNEVTVLNVTNPDAILMVTIGSTGGGFPLASPVGVTYYATEPAGCPGAGGKWAIYTTAGATDIPNGTTFNVLVINK